MQFRIEVLGLFRLVDLRSGSPIQLRSYARLLAHLAYRAPSYVSRKDLVREFFFDVDHAAANNRLRVALSRFRQQLPGIILESPQGLALNLEVTECDVVEYRNLAQSSRDTANESDELEALIEAVRYLNQREVFATIADWEIEDSTELFDSYYQACVRAGELGLKMGRFGLVEEVTSSALKLWPDDVALWKCHLEASIALGQGNTALRSLRSLRDRELLFHDEIAPLVARIANGDSLASGNGLTLTNPESQLAVEIFKVMLTSKLEIARAVLSSPETLTLAGARPKQMLSLLQQVVGDPRYGDPDWERCMARIAGLRAWLNDAQGVLEAANLLVAGSTDPIILRATWNAIGVAHSLRREWPEAMAAVEKTVQYAKVVGNEIDVISAQGNGAAYLWMQGNFEESDREYERTLRLLKQIGTDQAQFEYVIGSGNRCYIPVMQGDWPRALQLLEEAHELRKSGKTKVAMGTLLPCLAMVRTILGNHDGVLAMTRQGFLDANETESDRSQQIVFEFAAGTLAQTKHKQYARSVVDWVKEWRERTKLPRATAETQLMNLIFTDTEPSIRLHPQESPSLIGREILSRLRQSLN